MGEFSSAPIFGIGELTALEVEFDQYDDINSSDYFRSMRLL